MSQTPSELEGMTAQPNTADANTAFNSTPNNFAPETEMVNNQVPETQQNVVNQFGNSNPVNMPNVEVNTTNQGNV